MQCIGCDKDFRPDDTAPAMRNPDGTIAEACRKCIGTWIKEGFIANVPFWARKEYVIELN